MAKVIVTAEGETPEAKVDAHFGRCKYLLVCDPETNQVEKSIANDNATAQGGAGVSTAQMVADLGAKQIITGNIGPKAYQALSTSGIEIFVADSGTVTQALADLKDGKLEKVSDASAPMHTGLGAKKE